MQIGKTLKNVPNWDNKRYFLIDNKVETLYLNANLSP